MYPLYTVVKFEMLLCLRSTCTLMVAIIMLCKMNNCRAVSSANNLALLNFEYLAIYLSIYLFMCVRFGMQSISLSPPTSHSMHSTIDGGIFCRHEPAFSAPQSSETQSSIMQQRRDSPRRSPHGDLLPKGSQ